MMNLLSIFAQSPFNPIQEHIKMVHQSVGLLPAFLEALYQSDLKSVVLLHTQCKIINKEANYLKQQMCLQLPKQFFHPLKQNELFELFTEQQQILTMVIEIINVLAARTMKLSEALTQNLVGFVHVCLNALDTAQSMMNEFDNKGSQTQAHFNVRVANRMQALDELLGDAEQIHREIVTDIVTYEKKSCPIEISFYYQIIDNIKRMMVNTQQVGYRVQLMS